VLLLLFHETVWKKVCADYPLLQILVKNLTNHLPVNVQLILHQFQGYLMVSGHKLTNCCTLFLNFEQLMGSLTLDQVEGIQIPL